MTPPPVPTPASSEACRRVAFPPERRFVLDTLRLGHDKPMMHGLLEVDVTRARQLLRDHRARCGAGFSFTAFVLACLGKAIAAHPQVHALRDWAGRLVLFEDVDVTTLVEVDVEGRPFAMAHVVRSTNRRTAREIHDELRAIQAAGIHTVRPGLRRTTRIARLVPGVLRRLLFRFILRFPRLAKRHTGTALLTAVGMFGGGVGWGLSAPGLHSLSVVVGGIATRASADGAAGAREVLCLTVSADHDRVDGAPLARFVRDLRAHLETADGLAESLAPGAAA